MSTFAPRNQRIEVMTQIGESIITDTITRGFQEAKEGRFAGKGLANLDTLIGELRAEV